MENMNCKNCLPREVIQAEFGISQKGWRLSPEGGLLLVLRSESVKSWSAGADMVCF